MQTGKKQHRQLAARSLQVTEDDQRRVSYPKTLEIQGLLEIEAERELIKPRERPGYQHHHR